MFSPNQQIGSYTLVRRLGRGGFGEVWLAERRMKFVTTKVALKLPLDSEVDYEAIKQEARIWERASGHPNVVPIIEADECDGQAIVVSEYIDGGSLDQVLEKRGGYLPEDEAVRMTIGVLCGLEFLHSRDIIHRDVKPANVLLQGETPRLTDFGVSRVLKATSASLRSAGTPHYMAPEAFDGKRTAQTDLWSAGVMFYEMLTGKYPFRGEGVMEIMAAIVNGEPEPLPPEIDHSIRTIITKALKKRPAERYEQAESLRKDLQELIYKTRLKLDPSLHETIADEPEPVTISLNEARKKSIAILPFKNLGGDPAVQFYEFSLADAVTTELARLRSIVVRPSSMIAKYVGRGIDPCDAGREMLVDSVLACGYMVSRSRVRVTAQLLDTQTREIVWSDRIDADADDIFALQDTITQQIINGLNVTLTTSEQALIDKRPTDVNAAYEAYLRGRHYWGRFIFRTNSRADCEAAVENLELATQLDPEFALAWSGLGSCFANKVFKAFGDRSDYERARIAFEHALSLDSGLAEAQVMMIWIYLASGEKAKARSALQSVGERFPDHPAVLFCKAVVHRLKGEYQQALSYYGRLERLDPASEVAVKGNRGRIYSLMGDHERGLREIDAGLVLEPDNPLLSVFRSQVLFRQGEVEAAVSSAMTTLDQNPHLEGLRPFLAMLLAAQDKPAEAREQLSPTALERARADHDIAYWTASAFSLLGERDAAMEWVKQSIDLGMENRKLFEADPAFEGLRDESKFKGLMDRISNMEVIT